jgi:hypothetical protein
MTTAFNYSQGLPPLPPAKPATRPAQPPTGDELQPMRSRVADLARQAGQVATVNIAAYEQSLAAKAEALTRAAYYRASADVLVTALHTCVEGCFECVDGVLVGMEPSGRINVQLPWSKRSHGLYALRRSQADLLRVIVLAWALEYAAGRYERAPVFVRDDREHRWYFNLTAYRTADAAHKGVGAWITPGYVRECELATRQLRGK